jgi:outer membrane cobalamin receptor
LNWRSKIDVPLNIDLKSNSVIYANYLQFQFLVAKHLNLKLGLRNDYSTLNKQNLISPRLSFSYQFKPAIKIFGAFGDYYQFPSLMSSITRGEPLDISQNLSSLKAEKSTHFILGSEFNFHSEYTFKLTGYYKNYNNLLVPKDYTTFIATNDGNGFAKGLEISIKKDVVYNNLINWQVNYSIAKSRYRSINNVHLIPFKWDQPHSLNALLNFNLSSNCDLGFRWNYNSGLPSSFNYERHVFINRYPFYSRLDFKFGYSFGEKIRYLLYLDLINITNRKNVYANNWDFHESQNKNLDRQNTIYTMPFLASIGLKIDL